MSPGPACRDIAQVTGAGSSSLSSAYLAFGRVGSIGALATSAILSARELAPAGRGVLVVLVTVSSLTALLFTTGVTMAGRVLLVSTRSDRAELGHYLGLGLALMSVVAVVLAIAGVTVVPSASVRPAGGEVALLMLHGAATVASVLLTNALYAYGAFGVASLTELSGGITTLAATAALAAAGSTRPRAYLAVLAGGLSVQSGAALFALRNRGLRPRLHAASWSRLLRRGAAGTGVGVAQAATYRFDRYLVGLFASPAQVGLYSAAATAAELLRLVPTAVGQVVLQRVAVAGELIPEGRRLGRLAVGFTAVTALVLAGLAKPLLSRVLGAAYAPADTALIVLLVAEVATAWFLVDSSMLAGLGRFGSASRAAITGFVTVTAFDFLLIPEHGIEGAAVASLLGYLAMALVARRAVVNSRRGSSPPPAAFEAKTQGH